MSHTKAVQPVSVEPQSNTSDTQENDISALASGAGLVTVGRFLGRGIHILGQILLARWLGAEGYGLYALGWTVLMLMSLVGPLGLEKGVVNFLAQCRGDASQEKEVIFKSLLVTVGFSSVLAIVIFLFEPVLAKNIFDEPGLVPLLRLFAIAAIGFSCLKVLAAATTINRNMRYSVFSQDIFQPVLNTVLILIVHLLGYGLTIYVSVSVVSFFSAFILVIFLLPRVFTGINSSEFSRTFSYQQLVLFSFPIAMASLMFDLNTRADKLLMGYFLTASDVGVYQATSQVATSFALILSGFLAILIPMISSLYHQGAHERLNNLFKVSTKWTLYICLPLGVIFVLDPHPLMGLLFGSEYRRGAAALSILSLGQIFNVATGPVGLLLIMTGNQRRWFVVTLISLLSNITLNVILIPWLELPGAALSTTISTVLVFSLALWQVRIRLSLWPYDRRYLKILFATAAAVVGVFVVILLDIDSDLLRTLVSLATSFGLFWFVVLLNGLDDEERQLVTLFQNRVRGQKAEWA